MASCSSLGMLQQHGCRLCQRLCSTPRACVPFASSAGWLWASHAWGSCMSGLWSRLPCMVSADAQPCIKLLGTEAVQFTACACACTCIDRGWVWMQDQQCLAALHLHVCCCLHSQRCSGSSQHGSHGLSTHMHAARIVIRSPVTA